MNKKIILEALDVNNWLKICDLSVSDEQKAFFPIPNVYWIGISRYEEGTELFAIKADAEYIGLIGGGYDEDGVTGYINPIMIDHRYQKNGYAKSALRLMIDYLCNSLGVNKININHRKESVFSRKIYESLGFFVYNETENEYQLKLDLTQIIFYRQLQYNELERIREIDASQYIGRAWRNLDGIHQLVEINYQDTDFPHGYDNHLAILQETVKAGGSALGAFFNGKLIGFCSVNPKVFGKKYRYVLLDQIFISLEYRAKGIGKQLFLLSVTEAKKNGADKFYICSASSEETIAFYKALGCVEAKEINQELYESDTRDIQLEYAFTNWNY